MLDSNQCKVTSFTTHEVHDVFGTKGLPTPRVRVSNKPGNGISPKPNHPARTQLPYMRKLESPAFVVEFLEAIFVCAKTPTKHYSKRHSKRPQKKVQCKTATRKKESDKPILLF